MVLLLSLILCADPGLEVYRSRAELPQALAKTLPADFDFKKEMLAGHLDRKASRIVVMSPAGSHFDGKDTWMTPPDSARCPPCNGVNPKPDEQGAAAESRPVGGREVCLLWRVPRAKGGVYVLEAPPVECRPCTRG